MAQSELMRMVIALQADVSQLKGALAQAEASIKNVDNSVKVADGGMKKMIGTLKGVAGAMGVAFAGAQISRFAKDSIMAASDMAESLSKVRVVFGEGAAQVEAFGKTAAENLGISNQAALEAAGTYGNLFQAFGLGQGQAQEMSTSLVQLAADMASFNNTSIDDAITALRSGLSGETEPLKRFGVALNDVRLKQVALDMGLIESTKGVLPPAIKAQAAYALIMKDTTLAQGDYARTADGTANTMKTLQARLKDAKVALGDALMPAFRGMLKILNLIIPMIEKFGKFIKNNQDEIKAFAITLAVLTAGYGAYTIVVNRAKIAQAALNIVMKANPIGLIITGIALLVAGLVAAYKRLDWFRNGVQAIFKKVVEAVGNFIGMIATLIEAVAKIPGIGKKFEGVADAIRRASDRTKEFGENIGKVTQGAMGNFQMSTGTTLGSKTKTTGDTDSFDTKAKEAADKRKKQLEQYRKDVKEIQKDVKKVLLDADYAKQDALTDYNRKVVDLNRKYAEQVADIREQNARDLVKIAKEYREKIAEIEIANAEKVADIRKAANDKLAELQKKHEERIAEIQIKGVEKQRDLLQKSIDRLRSAFASGVQFSVAQAFKETGSTGGFLGSLKKRLEDAQALAKGSAELAARGYSQTFLEEITKAGTTEGLSMIQQLLGASPEQQAEIQSAYSQLEAITNDGLNTLAARMNEGGKLATDELRTAYDQVAIDVQESLKAANDLLAEEILNTQKELTEALAEQAKAFEAAKVEAAKIRDEQIADAMQKLDEALAEAQKDLQRSLYEAQLAYNRAIDDINISTQRKLEELRKKLQEIMALITAIGGLTKGLGGGKGGGGGGSGSSTGFNPVGSSFLRTYERESNSGVTNYVYNNTINTTNMTEPDALSRVMLSQIKYGQVVTIPDGGNRDVASL